MLAEQRLNPPERSDEHYALIDQIDAAEERLNKIRQTQELWTEFDTLLTQNSPPAEISEAWSKLSPWLLSSEGATVVELNLLLESEQDLLF